MTLHLETAALSRRGNRDSNEDAIHWQAQTDAGIWVVADGLGGHGGGVMAALLTAQTLASDSLDEFSPAGLERRFADAQQVVQQRQQEDPEYRHMHSTAVALAIKDGHALWAHCGDSRLTWFRQGRVVFQTKDHSFVQAKVDAGVLAAAEIRGHPDRSRLLSSIGSASTGFRVTTSPQAEPLTDDDAFLLSSDGFWEAVTEAEMEADWAKALSAEQWLQRLERRLLDRKLPGQDNYSAIAVWLHGATGGVE